MLDHTLLTRFNLPSGGVEAKIRASEDWLRNRGQLFERYCAPSVGAQTSTRHRWIIYFDPESPRWLRDAIAPYVADNLFTPIYRAKVPRADLITDIRAVASSGSQGVITTNLDNDDALAIDFLERVQAAAEPGSRHAIYLIHGLTRGPEGLYRRTDRNNAFCSVAEPWDDPQTCWSDWHNRLRLSMPVVEVRGAPGWLQVVHGQNVSNRIRGRLVSPEPWKASFFPGALNDVEPPRRTRLVIDRLVAGPLRSARGAARSAARRTAIALLGKEGMQKLQAKLRQ